MKCKPLGYDKTSPVSIFEYSEGLIGNSLFSLFGQSAIDGCNNPLNKGELGQNVETLFFNYQNNSDKGPDFSEAKLELKCAGLEKYVDTGKWKIKERLVCGDINYSKVVAEKFETSTFFLKCKLMLLLFYFYKKGAANYDLQFVLRVLWLIPEEDLEVIRKDYETIVDMVVKGRAHELSEGMTSYLAACRGGGASTKLQEQPYSDQKAKARRFSLKASYMRTILEKIKDGETSFTNVKTKTTRNLFTSKELKNTSLEDLILNRILRFKGMDYREICNKMHYKKTRAKHKYALITKRIISPDFDISRAEELKKAGYTIKTIRINSNGKPEEAMSFKNIDYEEIFHNDEWTESECYELFSGKFLFVVYQEVSGETLTYKYYDIQEKKNCFIRNEKKYILRDAFYWIMPQADLDVAEMYWNDIRKNVTTNNIRLSSFWHESMNLCFHVRPKGQFELYKNAAINPNGGFADKFCYWFNHSYVWEFLKERELDNYSI